MIPRKQPNVVALRQISQLICLDALHRLEQGNDKGSSNAIRAGWKMTANLGEQPAEVSFLVRANIEQMFTCAIARLPEDFDALGPIRARHRGESRKVAKGRSRGSMVGNTSI